MNVIRKGDGNEYIAYETTNKSIIFGDEDLSINLKNRERDEKVLIDVCSDGDGDLVIGTAAGYRYVAQIEIPAREYTETEKPNPDYDPEKGDSPDNPEYIIERTAVPFDIDKCTLYLWALDNNTSNYSYNG